MKNLTMSGAQFFEERSETDSSTGLRGAHISLRIVHTQTALGTETSYHTRVQSLTHYLPHVIET